MTKVQLITNNLLQHIQTITQKSNHIYWLIAFAMESGVEAVLPTLKTAAKNGAEIKILIGDYLYITNPRALEQLQNELPTAHIRLFKSDGRSFHPKAYLFQDDVKNHVIVGSSNLSKSALTNGVEWSLYANEEADEEVFSTAVHAFMKLFLHEQTIPLNRITIEQYASSYDLYRLPLPGTNTLSKTDEFQMMFGDDHGNEVILDASEKDYASLKPRPAQAMALEQLEITLEEQYDKALVVLATGLGKTYLAAFFAKKFNRVLFIAHREELLHQAERSFQHVFPNKKTGIYNGTEKNKEADFIFASVFTLGTEVHLQNFSPDEFDLIVIDEFHHAVTSTYEQIRSYFSPKFLLGITATPDRLDNKDVYSLCDGNVAISIDFLEAIRQNWLSPFAYYGTYDDTDYRKISWRNNGYDADELLGAQLQTTYADTVLQAWKTHKQTRTIGFCSSIKQAEFLSSYFNEAGYNTIALHGLSNRQLRKDAITRLNDRLIDIIFTVDLFNEGVDIPSVDTLLFARPTESLTVFTQQIGRGLRLADGKTHCVIIDLIGNYRNADVKLQVFQSDALQMKDIGTSTIHVPENCSFELDFHVINLLKEMRKKRAPRKEQIMMAYDLLKEQLGRRPTYIEMHLKSMIDAKSIQQEFGSYPGLLKYMNDLSPVELEVLRAHENWFLNITTTSMNKSYKMVVLAYLLTKGPSNWLDAVTPEEIAPYFHQYLTGKDYRMKIDFSDKQGKELRDYNEQKIVSLLKRMPLAKWSSSSKGLISFENNLFTIHIDVDQVHQEILYEWTTDICDYRLHTYFERKHNKKTKKDAT